LSAPATYLDRIVARHRQRAERDERDRDDLTARCMSMAPARGFRSRLQFDSTDGLSVIAEIKRRSPSKGDLLVDLDPARLSEEYRDGGASCLSVLTDEEFFGGSIRDLQIASATSGLPVLRKDFTVSVLDVLDARLMGADCVLLIAAALSAAELSELHSVARLVGLDVLVEIHDELELERALAVGSDLVGVNQRDLVTFRVDHERALRMGAIMPTSVVRVAESGVRGPNDAADLRAAGYHAVLVGESLVTSDDPRSAVRALRDV
jgi:indole-3-glycerol phosphate synthase